MDVVQVVINAVVVTAVGLVLGAMTHGLRRELKAEIGELRRELKSDISGLRSELRGKITELRAEMRSEIREVRSDLTRVALAVGAERRARNT